MVMDDEEDLINNSDDLEWDEEECEEIRNTKKTLNNSKVCNISKAQYYC